MRNGQEDKEYEEERMKKRRTKDEVNRPRLIKEINDSLVDLFLLRAIWVKEHSALQ